MKISYSTSFGASDHNPPREYINQMAPLLKRFDSISVREDYAVNIATMYEARAVQVIDAVFLPEISDYLEIAKDANIELPNKYLVGFILDPTDEKRKQIECIAKKLQLEILMIPDAAAAYHEKFNKIFSGLKILNPLSISNFIKAYANAQYVVTDSFHGTCMSYVFRKDFNVYFNERRGADRFVSLMNLLGLNSRRIYEKDNEKDITSNPNIGFNVSWTIADNNVLKEKEFSLNWLKNSLLKKKSTNKYPSEIITPDINELRNNFDFIKIRLLATLLRDYGVRHIVLSPGGRDVPIIRMFEYNENQFVLHRVTDERSAAYFGLGIASQINQPVACVCTSGTAASNYLPAITEAYYTGVPLIMITADRYGVYLNHGEDQTIPQKNIFNGVVKMSVSLPENGGYLPEYQTRRDISDCILESTHNGFGPVHINVPIQNITIGSKVSKDYWALLPKIYPHILRVSFNNGERDMLRWVDSLKQSKRILIVYGQNKPLSQKQKQDIEKFVSKYNCVILTDSISNLHCSRALNAYNMLNAINQDEFNNKLLPDILISVGGKRLMNDPLTEKIRDSRNGVRHWSVTPDGKVKDFYFRLSSVIECTQDYFFEWFAEKAGNVTNNNEYYNLWKSMVDSRTRKEISSFNSLWIQDKFVPLIPENSFLHLGVGQNFFDIRRNNIKPSVEVYCNMGTNGIDGCTSTFMGQTAIIKDRLCFLLVGDLSFFYDMNGIWNKQLNKNIRILMVNNNGSGLLNSHNLKGVTSIHNTIAEGWVKSTGFEYMSAKTKEEFEQKLSYFVSRSSEKALFFEVFCNR